MTSRGFRCRRTRQLPDRENLGARWIAAVRVGSAVAMTSPLRHDHEYDRQYAGFSGLGQLSAPIHVKEVRHVSSL